MKKKAETPDLPTERSLMEQGVVFPRNQFGKLTYRVSGVSAGILRDIVTAEVARRVELFAALISSDQHVPGDTRGWSKWRTVNREPTQYGECCHCGEQLCYVTAVRAVQKTLHATHRSGPCALCEAALEKATKIACVIPAQKISLQEAFRRAEALGPAVPQWVKAPWE